MSIKTRITQALGRDAPYVEVLPVPILAQRAPIASDNTPAGQLWYDQAVSPIQVYVSNGDGTYQNISSPGLSLNGAVNINTSGSGITTIGTGGTGAVDIGNATGNTQVTGSLNVTGNLSLTSVATKISMNGGSVTDFIGTATLVAGTVTVANTNIAAGDRIMITRNALNASPALGNLIYTISAGASFTVTSYDDTGAAATTDVSGFSYVIFRQT